MLELLTQGLYRGDPKLVVLIGNHHLGGVPPVGVVVALSVVEAGELLGGGGGWREPRGLLLVRGWCRSGSRLPPKGRVSEASEVAPGLGHDT